MWMLWYILERSDETTEYIGQGSSLGAKYCLIDIKNGNQL